MNLPALAASIAAKLPELFQDSRTNAADVIQGMIAADVGVLQSELAALRSEIQRGYTSDGLGLVEENATLRDQRDAYAADVAEWHEWIASVVGGMSNKEAMRARLVKPRLCETCKHCEPLSMNPSIFKTWCSHVCAAMPEGFGCVSHETKEVK